MKDAERQKWIFLGIFTFDICLDECTFPSGIFNQLENFFAKTKRESGFYHFIELHVSPDGLMSVGGGGNLSSDELIQSLDGWQFDNSRSCKRSNFIKCKSRKLNLTILTSLLNSILTGLIDWLNDWLIITTRQSV